jgi:hypothetical protein
MFETLVMADSISNYATAADFIVGLGVLLFVVRARRSKEKKSHMTLAASQFNYVGRSLLCNSRFQQGGKMLQSCKSC